MFVDKVTVDVQAGDGGNGAVSFRHEKYVDKGGPDGGDGGQGGSIVVRSSRNNNTLAEFRYSKLLKAESGQAGSKRKRHGKNAKTLVVKVPIGTVVTDEKGTIMADLIDDGQEVIIAKGGNGGYGNAHFVSSTRQVPRIAEKGEPGQKLSAQFELKMIADVGLVGLPNAGKSTFLGAVSNARPEIADYPFTTLSPNLGVVDIDDNSVLIADIPGLIEGASQGKGLGDEFLRHVERTAVLIHLIDAYNEKVDLAYKTIIDELAAYEVDLSRKPQIIAITKIEGLDDEIINAKIAEINKICPKTTLVTAISSQSGVGVKELLRKVAVLVTKNRQKIEEIEMTETVPVLTLEDTSDSWQVEKTKKGYVVSGEKIERFASRTDFENPHGVERLRDIMRKMGIMHDLERKGIDAGDDIIFKDHGSIEY